MAKRKEEQWVFDASAKTVKIPGHIETHDLLMIVNATSGIIIANQFDPGKGWTRSHGHIYPGDVGFPDPDFPWSIDGTCTFTLDYDTTSMSDDDELSIYIEDERHGVKTRPFDFGTDAIERMRVANPESLIDADFEYGLQATKWHNLGLHNNYPSFYETPGVSLEVTNITSGGTGGGITYSEITVTVTADSPPVGASISVFGLTNGLAEGLFIVLTSTATTFTYQAKGLIAAGSIITPYTTVKEGGVFTGAPLPITSMSGNGVGGLVTVNFTNNHGLFPGAPITVVDTTAGTQSHEGSFFVQTVVDADTIIYNAGQNVTNGAITTTNISLYARNDSFFIHRPFDGGVLMGATLPAYGLQAIRQTKRYFRYQSGKGMLFSTGTLFCPVFDVQSITYSAPNITITTQIEHGLQPGATIKLYGVTSANYEGDYVVTAVTSDVAFTVAAGGTAPTVTPAILEDQPRIAVVNWIGSSVRTGMFDDTNGVFWEFDGQTLYVVRRSSTFQLAGTVAVTNGSHIVTGTTTRFEDQLKVGDAITIRGQKYVVTTITSQTILTISPEYRGSTQSGGGIKPTIVRELRIPSTEFNYDKLDGEGPSGYNIRLYKMQMMAIQWSWYGAGFVDFMVRGPLGEFITAHRMPGNNVNDEAYMRTGNLPARYEVINEAAKDKLAVASGTTGNLTLVNASRFPSGSATYPAYVLVTGNIAGSVFHEVISYTGKTGNDLTGTTRATTFSQFLTGASRTFGGTTTARNHPAGSSVILLNTSCAPTISHWGSAVIMDGGYDKDAGYLFNIADFNLSVAGNSTETVLLFRLAPSVSNTLPGLLGDREVINRSIIQLVELEVQGDRSLEIAGVINPSNNLSALTWRNASSQQLGVQGVSGGPAVFQPSFAQYIPNSVFTDPPTDGEVIFRYITPPSRANKATFDLTSVKALENGIIGGNGTYPNGPEVLAIVVSCKDAQAATIDFSLKWTEAQA
jgi:hypothetical protein